MSSPTTDPAVVDGMTHMVEYLDSLGPAGIVAVIMWMWKEREAKRADALQTKFDKAIDRALEGDDHGGH